MGGDPRSSDPTARGGRHPSRADDPSRHAVPQNPELHRQGETRRRQPGVHWIGECQSGQSCRGQEAAEQNHRVPKMLLAWKAHGIITVAGYILGFPADTPDSIRRDIAIIQRELPLDIVEFFCLTPLPGSEDHQVLWKNGVAMEPDLNIYDVEHVCAAHANMSKADWEAIYREAWSLYYTPQHMKTLMRRAAATGVPTGSLLKLLVSFATTVRLENVHPLQSGIVRLKHPSERRPGLPRERVWTFGRASSGKPSTSTPSWPA